MESLKQVMMRRDDLSSEEVDAMIADAKAQVREGADPEEVLLEDFGLEPDYMFEILD